MAGEYIDVPHTQIRADGRRYPHGEGPGKDVQIPDWLSLLQEGGIELPSLITSTSVEPMAPAAALSRFLDTVGDGTGDKNAIGDYSLTEEIFRITPSPTEVYEISRMNILIEGTRGLRPSSYGSILNGLVSGVNLRVHNGLAIVNDLNDGSPIRDNTDWASVAYDVTAESDRSASFVHILWDFAEAGATVVLDGSLNEELQVVLNDDFSNLSRHTFKVMGVSPSQ